MSWYPRNSGVHRLFEEQGRNVKKGHIQRFFATEEGTLAHVFAPKRAVYHVLTSQRGSFMYFANQDGTLAHVFEQLGHEGGRPPPLPPTVHTTAEEVS